MKSWAFVVNFLFFALCFSCSYLSLNHQDLSSDTYWNGLVERHSKEKGSFLNSLKLSSPKIYQQIMLDTTDPLLLDLWGESHNRDSGAKMPILPDAMMSELQAAFGVKNDNLVVHAGIMHTYGYLFSTLNTAFGYKRKRWIAPTLNRGFKFNDLALSPQTEDGTLFSNVTYFMAQVSFKLEGQKALLSELKNVASSIRSFDYKALKITTIEETPALEESTLMIRTTLVEIPHKTEGEINTHLLIYSVFDLALQKESLITAFPVREDVYKSWLEPTTLGSDRLINLRYNGAHPRLSGGVMRGKRELVR